MALLRPFVALVLLATLLVPAAAQAKVKARPAKELGAAFAAAQRHWGAVPCGDNVRILLQRPQGAGVDPDADAWATFDTPSGANDLSAPASSYTSCTIAFGRGRWPTSASLREDWDMFCATMVHEVGHLLGHSHDAAPGSVMTPVFTDVTSVPRVCRTARRR